MTGIFLDVVTTSAVLFFVTLGLLIVFGMMRIINFAHGAFLTVGAYATVVVDQQGLSPWFALLLAPVAAAILGCVVEFVMIRRLYGRPLDTILATWGLTLILTQLITLHFGRGTQAVRTVSLGATQVFGTQYSEYRLILVPMAVVFTAALVLVLQRTRYGLVGRAVIMDESLAQTLGVNTKRVRFVSFALGSAIAGFAGALLVPLASVDPNFGTPWLIYAFMLSLLVGISTPALAAATLLFGTAQVAVGVEFNAIAATLTVPILAVIILRIRPAGLVARH